MKPNTRPPLAGQATRAGLAIGGTLFSALALIVTVIDAALIYKGVALLMPDLETATFGLPGDGRYLVWGIAAVVAMYKATEVSFIAAAGQRRMYGVVAVVVGCAVLMHIFSAVCAIGYAGAGRDASISTRTQAQDARKRAQAAYDDARLRKAALPATRHIGAIEADIARVTADIAQAAKVDRAALRARRDELQAEARTARDAIKAEADLAAASTRLDDINAPIARDPAAESVARLLPWDTASADRIAIVMPLLPSLVVEFGAPVCALIGTVLMGMAGGASGPRGGGRRTTVRERDARSVAGPRVDHAEAAGPNVVQMPTSKRQRTTITARPRSAKWSADQAFAALEMADQRGMTEREIVAATGIAKTTVNRMLAWARANADQIRTTAASA